MVVLIVMLIIALVMALAFHPHAKAQPPPSLQDFNAPIAQDGREVIDVCGTVWVDDPNVIWYGDLYTMPVRVDGGK